MSPTRVGTGSVVARIVQPVRWIALLLIAAAALAACGESEPARAPREGAEIHHIHGLGRDPADGALLIATHTGLFRVPPGGATPARVGDSRQDTMGFTVVGPRHFLGSGHPADVTEDPPFLGLIESRDGGQSWRPLSLRGEVDFHVLEASGDTVYGFGSDWATREDRFLKSRDGGRSWTALDPPDTIASLAVDPASSRRIVALGERRAFVSVDGGTRWRPIGVPGGLVAWTRELGIVAVGFDGVVRHAGDPTGEWNEVGELDAPPAALEGVGRELVVATHEGGVQSSTDGGASWQRLVGG